MQLFLLKPIFILLKINKIWLKGALYFAVYKKIFNIDFLIDIAVSISFSRMFCLSLLIL